jgi:hypothetical protein
MLLCIYSLWHQTIFLLFQRSLYVASALPFADLAEIEAPLMQVCACVCVCLCVCVCACVCVCV